MNFRGISSLRADEIGVAIHKKFKRKPEFLANSKAFCPLFCGNFWQKQSFKFTQRGCPRKKLDLLTQIFSFGSKRFASFYTLFLLSAFLVGTFKAIALNLDTSHSLSMTKFKQKAEFKGKIQHRLIFFAILYKKFSPFARLKPPRLAFLCRRQV